MYYDKKNKDFTYELGGHMTLTQLNYFVKVAEKWSFNTKRQRSC